MLWLIFLPVLVMFSICLSNFIAIKQPREAGEISDFVSVIVPLRNEAHNIRELVQSLAAQRFLNRVEFILLDDNSEDQTQSIITSSIAGFNNFRLIQGEQLPADWIGKTWALAQLLDASHGEIIVSLDADVRITSDAISKSITLMKSKRLDFISPYPRQIVQTLGERLIQPLLQWSWMSTLVLAIVERSRFSSMAVANGQFFIVKRSVLVESGGYECVKTAVLDDVFLARALMKSGFKGVAVNGANISEVRMYTSWTQIKSGYGKSLRYAFGSNFGAFIAVLFLLLTGVAPLILTLMGSMWGWISLTLIILTRILSAIRFRGRILDSIFHPISSLLLIYLIFYSFRNRGEIVWKGRVL